MTTLIGRILFVCTILHGLNVYGVISVAAPYSTYIMYGFYAWCASLALLVPIVLLFWWVSTKGATIEKWVNNLASDMLSHRVEATSWQERLFRNVAYWFMLRQFKKGNK